MSRLSRRNVTTSFITNTDIEYNPLVEFSGMSIDPNNLRTVGKVFPGLKIVVISDEELVAAMSYKSNRNYTLPDLSAEHVHCDPCTGCLLPGQRMYLTYGLKISGDTGMTTTLPCQRYTVVQNNTTTGAVIFSGVYAINLIDILLEKSFTSFSGFSDNSSDSDVKVGITPNGPGITIGIRF